MSNNNRNMNGNVHRLPTPEERRMAESQQEAALVSTRFQLSQQFLVTMIARNDVDLTNPDNVDALTGLAVEYAEALMVKAGLAIKKETDTNVHE